MTVMILYDYYNEKLNLMVTLLTLMEGNEVIHDDYDLKLVTMILKNLIRMIMMTLITMSTIKFTAMVMVTLTTCIP